MEKLKFDKSTIVNGLFYFLSYEENPLHKKVKQIMEVESSDKILNDLRNINRDYRKSLDKIKENFYCLES